MESEKRDSYMDFLKGIAIIAVVAGHTVSDIEGVDILFNLIYSFHMPLLFFVSAYLEEKNSGKYEGREGQLIMRRMKGLLVPYLSWTIISAGVSGWFYRINITEMGLRLLGYENNGMWFFPVLFGLKMMHVLYRIIRRKFNRHSLFADILLLCGLEAVAVLLALLTRQPYIINMLSYAIPYFLAVIIVDHEVMEKLLCSEQMAAGAVLAYILLFPHFSFYDTRWTTQVVRIGLSLCVIVLCCKFKDQWRMNCFRRAICIYGENSLIIYVLHGFLTDYKKYFSMINSTAAVGMLSIILAIVVGAVCILIARVVGISSWWRKILFGK